MIKANKKNQGNHKNQINQSADKKIENMNNINTLLQNMLTERSRSVQWKTLGKIVISG